MRNTNKKITMNSLGMRFLYLFLSSIPLIIFIIMILNNYTLMFTFGYLLLFFVYFFLLSFYVKYTIFDWDIYFIDNSKVELKRLFNKSEILFVEDIKLSNKGIFTPLFFIYTVKINDITFFVKLKPIGIFTIFSIEKETERQYEKIKNKIFQTSVKSI